MKRSIKEHGPDSNCQQMIRTLGSGSLSLVVDLGRRNVVVADEVFEPSHIAVEQERGDGCPEGMMGVDAATHGRAIGELFLLDGGGEHLQIPLHKQI